MITRINDFAVHYPCYFVAKKTWYIKKVPIPCVALEKRIQHVAFVRKRPWIVGEDQWGVSKESSAENICTLDDDLILFPNHAEDELCPILEDYKLQDGNDGSKGIFLETHMEQCLWTNAPPPGGMPEFQGLRLLHVFSDMPRPPILRWSEEAVAHHEQLIDGVVNDGDSSSKEDISQINEVLQPSQYPVEPQETSELEEALNPTQTHDKVEAHKNSESATEDSTIISPHVSPKSWWNEWTDSLMGPQREYRYPSRFPVQTQDNESPMDELICPSPSVSSNSFFFETEFTDDGGLPSLDNTDQGSEPQWEGNDKGKSPSNQEPTKSSEHPFLYQGHTSTLSCEAGKGSEPLLEGKDQSMGKQGLNGLHATPSVPSPGTMHGLSLAGTGHGNEPLLVNGQPLPVPFVAGSQELVNLHVEHTLHYSRTVHQPSLDDTSHWSEPLLRQNDNDEPLGTGISPALSWNIPPQGRHTNPPLMLLVVANGLNLATSHLETKRSIAAASGTFLIRRPHNNISHLIIHANGVNLCCLLRRALSHWTAQFQ
ncbi:expressed unknown protein [Seminavis robusta]|uniref:Uncharacterized protein n=1 Tax=Seminavis robusta TaxID=568900 RepID=A0A9N8E8T1_9STRA|nr:expressed unknown protein [Seminavis robusta]|eukprot:Sro781_g201510.1 n/a (540) ;mRNA; f:1412-3031